MSLALVGRSETLGLFFSIAPGGDELVVEDAVTGERLLKPSRARRQETAARVAAERQAAWEVEARRQEADEARQAAEHQAAQEAEARQAAERQAAREAEARQTTDAESQKLQVGIGRLRRQLRNPSPHSPSNRLGGLARWKCG